jgi:hypothetical protein
VSLNPLGYRVDVRTIAQAKVDKKTLAASRQRVRIGGDPKRCGKQFCLNRTALKNDFIND